ncbi:MAG TPA: FAD-dependent oxidoreductase [Pilimelia sp.]|nr:FAD-dependent oxidoreductase [Pilimelia sp.]
MGSGDRVAVVGAGIFGVTAAIHLARAGHVVTVFDRAADILAAASSINQRRLHRGYHYPRSPTTVRSALEGVASFRAEYADAVVTGQRHYVAIARSGSLVDAATYMRFCEQMELDYREEHPPFLRREPVEVALRVREWSIDVDVLRDVSWRRLANAGVSVELGRACTLADFGDFDHVVVAVYGNVNAVVSGIPGACRNYQFEVCEKPVLRLSPAYRGTSTVVLDGPFMCVDPIQGTDRFLAGNVRHAIHAMTIGRYPLVPNYLRGSLNNGIRPPSRASRFPEFVADAARFFIGFERAEHVGSMYAIRAVLPGMEDTDARPTLVQRLDERTLTIFSGKIVTCVDAARTTVQHLATHAQPDSAHALPGSGTQGYRTAHAGQKPAFGVSTLPAPRPSR